MEYMINQINQLNFHLLQPRISKSRNMERDSSIIQCFKCPEMGHYSKECPNLPTLPSSIQRFFAKKGKTQVHLIELMSEGRKKALMGLERSFKILKDVIDVMPQTKQLVEDTTHPNVNIKRFKEMVKALKEKKKS